MLMRARALLAGGLVLGVGATLTVAAWTDQENAKATITAGTFGLSSATRDTPLGSHDGQNAAVLGLDATGLYPGAKKAGWIQIESSGSVAGSVTLSDVALGAPATAEKDQKLRDSLTVRVAIVSQASECTKDTTGGAELPLLTVPTAAQLPPVHLAPNGQSDAVYCVILSLSSNAPSIAQGGAIAPVWTFTGTTTAQ